MHLAQPALSQSIRQLERELGVSLFVRHPRGMRLTPAGAELLTHAQEAVRSADQAIATARAHRREQQRELRIGFLAPLTSIAIDILGAFERDQPLIKVVIQELGMGDHTQAVRRREVDATLLWAGLAEPGVVLDPLFAEPCAVCLAAGHPLAGRSELRFEEVEDEPLPAVPGGVPVAVTDFLHLGHLRRRPSRHTADIPGSMDEAVWLIASGRAICVGPRSVAHAVARPGMVVIPLVDVEPMTISIARRADDHRAAIRAFIHIAREHVARARREERNVLAVPDG